MSQGHRVSCKGEPGKGEERPEGEGRSYPRPVFCLSIQSAWFKGSCSPSEVSLIPEPLTLSARPMATPSSPLMADLWTRGQTCTSKSRASLRLTCPEVPCQPHQSPQPGLEEGSSCLSPSSNLVLPFALTSCM